MLRFVYIFLFVVLREHKLVKVELLYSTDTEIHQFGEFYVFPIYYPSIFV